MLQAYSQNVTVTEMQPIPFNNLTIQKGCTAEQISPTTFALNRCGVYMIACNASSAATETIQLYKNGVALNEAVSTGVSPGFVSLVQVNHNNSCRACDSPDTIQVIAETAGTITDASIVITKVV